MYIGGLDVGTSGSKVTVYDTDGNYVTSAYEEYDVKRVGGEHEIDVDSIVEAVYKVIAKTAKEYELAGNYNLEFYISETNGEIWIPVRRK
jgi:xylulokinase